MNQYIICHHGILGQKWGVRRFQNSDGSYTKAGEARYAKGKDAYDGDKLVINKADSSVTKKVKNDYNTMSDQEFLQKYYAKKSTYAKRVEKTGDPYKADKSGRKSLAQKARANDRNKAYKTYLEDQQNGMSKKEAKAKYNAEYKRANEKYKQKTLAIIADYEDVKVGKASDVPAYYKKLANDDANRSLEIERDYYRLY